MSDSLFPNKWVAVVVTAAVFYLCLFHGLDALGIIGPDEPRFAAIAQEMARTGDWVTPRLHGEPWFEKPILYYWSAAAAFRIFGENEFAARLPSALAAAMAALALAWTARRYYGAATAQLVLLMLPACVAFIGFGRGATTDMLFSCWLAIAMCCAARIIFEPASQPAGRIWSWLFGASLGVASLAKGPAALLLAGGAIGLWILLTRRWRDTLRALHPAGIVAFAVVALPWYVLVTLRNPEFFDIFFVSHNVARYTTPVFRHEQPFWFFGPVILLGLLPWTALLLQPLRDAWRSFRAGALGSSPAVFIACWAVFPVVFFSFSQSKLPGYVLPAIAPLIFLMARGAARATQGVGNFHRGTLSAVGVTFMALALSASYWASRLPEQSPLDPGQVRLLVLAVGSLGAGIAVLGFYGRVGATLQASALLIAGIVTAFNLAFIPALDAHLSPRATAVAAQRVAGDQPVAVHQLHRAWHYGLNYYFRRDLPEWTRQMPPETIIVTNENGVRDLLEKGYAVLGIEYVCEKASLVRVRSRQD